MRILAGATCSLQRMHLRRLLQRFSQHKWRQAVRIILPAPLGQDMLFLFFLAILMGWVSSPLVFCTLTKTIVDLTTADIASNWRLSPPIYRIKQVADTLAILTNHRLQRVTTLTFARSTKSHLVSPTCVHGQFSSCHRAERKGQTAPASTLSHGRTSLACRRFLPRRVLTQSGRL